MAGSYTKLAHVWADSIIGRGGMKAHLKKLSDKHGLEFVEDWADVHRRETAWAKNLLDEGEYIGLDTETTGINAVSELTEIAILDADGSSLVDTLVRPLGKIQTTARWTTGITAEDVKAAPRLRALHADVQAAFDARPLLLIYNADFDVRILKQSCYHNKLPDFKLPEIHDVMLHFARWVGDWNVRQDDYRWQRLAADHRARGDVESMFDLVHKMARR